MPSRRSTGNRDLVHRRPRLMDPLHTETTGMCTPHLVSRWGDQAPQARRSHGAGSTLSVGEDQRVAGDTIEVRQGWPLAPEAGRL